MNKYTKIRDFHASRSTGVGSSDIPTLAGYSKKYGQTPYTLYRQKIGLDAPSEAGPRAEWGHRLEGLVLAKWIENRYGAETASEYLRYKMRGMSSGPFKTETEARMPERTYVLAHADLIVEPIARAGERLPGSPWPATLAEDYPSDPCIVEAKSAGFFSAKRDDDDPDAGYSKTDFTQNGIPAAVFLQVQWQMLAYDVRQAYVAVLIDTGDYREYGPIIADPRTQEKCLALAERFWTCVQTKTEPKPETWGDIGLMWPDPKDTSAMLGGDDEMKARAMIGEYHALKSRRKEIDERTDEIQNALGILIGDNRTLVTAEGVKLASSWSVDSPSVPSLLKVAEVMREKIKARPVLLAEWEELDKERQSAIERIDRIVGIVRDDEEIADAVKCGYRVLRPAKIKGGE